MISRGLRSRIYSPFVVLVSGLVLTIIWIMLISWFPARLITSTILLMLSAIHI
jgi:hypothetical protein